METPHLADDLNVFYCSFDHPTFVRSVFCPCLISVFVSLVWSHVCSLCLVLVLPCSRHVLSYVCLSMPCALFLLFVSPPLTCSQSPGLLVLLLSPVSCYS